MERIDAVIDVFATCFQSVYVENYQSDVVHKYLALPLLLLLCACVYAEVGPQLVDRLSAVDCRLSFTCI